MAEGWMIGAASVIGPVHVRRGMVNQDAVAVRPGLEDTPAGTVFAALSDGHGSAPHFRSDRGASIAVDTAIEALEWATDGSSEVDLNDLADTVVAGWRQRVDADVAANPYRERVEQHYHPYGATVLGMMSDSDQMCLLQIGDGDILVGYPDGRIERPIAVDEGLVGEQTYSLCLPDASGHMKSWYAHREWDDTLPDFVLMCTDGVSKSLVDEAAFRDLAAQYRDRCLMGPEVFRETIAALPDWLENLVNQGSGDDASMALAVRSAPEGEME